MPRQTVPNKLMVMTVASSRWPMLLYWLNRFPCQVLHTLKEISSSKRPGSESPCFYGKQVSTSLPSRLPEHQQPDRVQAPNSRRIAIVPFPSDHLFVNNHQQSRQRPLVRAPLVKNATDVDETTNTSFQEVPKPGGKYCSLIQPHYSRHTLCSIASARLHRWQ